MGNKSVTEEKISIAQHNEKRQDVIDLKSELAAAKAEFAEIEKCEIVDNCPNCKGTGQVERKEDACSFAFNPEGSIMYMDCPGCKGKGYIND